MSNLSVRLQQTPRFNLLGYNFVRIHKTLKVTTALEAGVTDKLWNLEDIVKLLEEKEPQ